MPLLQDVSQYASLPYSLGGDEVKVKGGQGRTGGAGPGFISGVSMHCMRVSPFFPSRYFCIDILPDWFYHNLCWTCRVQGPGVCYGSLIAGWQRVALVVLHCCTHLDSHASRRSAPCRRNGAGRRGWTSPVTRPPGAGKTCRHVRDFTKTPRPYPAIPFVPLATSVAGKQVRVVRFLM